MAHLPCPSAVKLKGEKSRRWPSTIKDHRVHQIRKLSIRVTTVNYRCIIRLYPTFNSLSTMASTQLRTSPPTRLPSTSPSLITSILTPTRSLTLLQHILISLKVRKWNRILRKKLQSKNLHLLPVPVARPKQHQEANRSSRKYINLPLRKSKWRQTRKERHARNSMTRKVHLRPLQRQFSKNQRHVCLSPRKFSTNGMSYWKQ